MENPTHSIEIYLKYADLFDKECPVISQYCRIYYVQEYMKIAKQNDNGDVSKIETITLSSIIKKSAEAGLNKKYRPEKRKAIIEQRLNTMFQSKLEKIKDSNSDKVLCRRGLENILDLIKILTVFGPLSQNWVKVSEFCQKQIEAYSKELEISKFIIHV